MAGLLAGWLCLVDIVCIRNDLFLFSVSPFWLYVMGSISTLVLDISRHTDLRGDQKGNAHSREPPEPRKRWEETCRCNSECDATCNLVCGSGNTLSIDHVKEERR